MMVYCRYCAHQLHETALTCPQCGGVQNLPTAATAGARLLWLSVTAFVLSVICLLTLFDDRPVTSDAIAGQLLFGLPALGLGAFSLLKRAAGKKMAITSVILAPLAIAMTLSGHRIPVDQPAQKTPAAVRSI